MYNPANDTTYVQCTGSSGVVSVRSDFDDECRQKPVYSSETIPYDGELSIFQRPPPSPASSSESTITLNSVADESNNDDDDDDEGNGDRSNDASASASASLFTHHYISDRPPAPLSTEIRHIAEIWHVDEVPYPDSTAVPELQDDSRTEIQKRRLVKMEKWGVETMRCKYQYVQYIGSIRGIDSTFKSQYDYYF